MLLNILLAIWTSGKLPFDCQKIAKNLTFFQKKIAKNFHFFKKIAIGNFVDKNDNFCQFFWKKCQVFGNFLHLNGNFPEGQVFTVPLNFKPY